MEKIIDYEVEEMLAKKLEGKVLVHIYMLQYGKTISIIKDHYTVQKGIIYIVENKKLTPSKDTFFDLDKECVVVGIYNSSKTYKRIIKNYTYSEFKKLHKL